MALTRALSRSKFIFQLNGRQVAPTWHTRLQHNNASEEISSSSNSTRTLADIIQSLSRPIPEKYISTRVDNGFVIRYIPWHIVNRIMNLQAEEWSGEVRAVTYSNDGNSVSVVYRVTICGADGEAHRESIGTSSMNDTDRGDPVQKAESMAFRRACARFGVGLHLYHEELNPASSGS